MTGTIHDTLTDLGRGTPAWFTLFGRLLPAALFAQFLTAGLALFGEAGDWAVHAGLGSAISLPVLCLAGGALAIPRLRGFGWWACLAALFYLVQVALAAGDAPRFLAFHPANGALLLAVSLVLLAKIERRQSQVRKAAV
ncbi:DUF6220 domain-containing protein [Stappia sp.]|uniref:DUF6220 domain-containing protein n=1 Tax=Stappia sp. TaxID=1870903 RepID=UPI003A99C68D